MDFFSTGIQIVGNTIIDSSIEIYCGYEDHAWNLSLTNNNFYMATDLGAAITFSTEPEESKLDLNANSNYFQNKENFVFPETWKNQFLNNQENPLER